MTNTLPERLRASPTSALMQEAADRIDALTEALRPLAEIDLSQDPPNDFAWFVLKARAALAQEQGGSDAKE